MLVSVAVDMKSSLRDPLCIQKAYPLVAAEILIRVPSQHRYCRCAVLVTSGFINDHSGIEKIVACQLRLVIVIHSAKGFHRPACKGRKNQIPFSLISEKQKWSKSTITLDIEGDF